MPISEQEKELRYFQRMLEKSHEYGPTRYLTKYVARDFQRMIRAEDGAKNQTVKAISEGKLIDVHSPVGFCVCVTCAKVLPWASSTHAAGEGMDTGHFLPSRRASILLEESNVAPQCQGCNKHRGGHLEAFMAWMRAVRGQAVIDRLNELKLLKKTYEHEELVALRIEFKKRYKAAQQFIEERTKQKGQP